MKWIVGGIAALVVSAAVLYKLSGDEDSEAQTEAKPEVKVPVI